MTLPDTPLTPEDLDRIEAAESETRRRRALFAIGGSCIAALVVVVSVQWAVDTPDEATVPEFELTALEGEPFQRTFDLSTGDGEPFQLTSVVGAPTVLNFFATWCAPCRAELPEFEEVSQEFVDDVAFLGVNTRETDVDGARALIDETGVTFPVAVGDDGDLFEIIGGLGMPTTAFIDADGVIVEVHTGALDDDSLRDKIESNFG